MILNLDIQDSVEKETTDKPRRKLPDPDKIVKKNNPGSQGGVLPPAVAPRTDSNTPAAHSTPTTMPPISSGSQAAK